MTPHDEQAVATATAVSWWIATVGRIPLNFSSPVAVAIQARDKDHAESRLRKLYHPNIYAGYGPSRSLGEDLRMSADPDDRANARQHPLADTEKT